LSKPADFWSRRKAAVADAEAAEDKAAAEAEAVRERARLEEMTDAEILDELGLRDPDEMQAGDDFSAFLKAAVPDRLRRRALRLLWRSNPVLANVDHLVEYGEDYTDAATVVADMQTAIRLGRGALDRAEEQVAAVNSDEAPAAVKDTENGPETAVETGANQSEAARPEPDDSIEADAEVALEPEDAGGDPQRMADAAAEPHAPRPRRMRSHFSD